MTEKENDVSNWNVSECVGVPEHWFDEIPTLTEKDTIDWKTDQAVDMYELGSTLTHNHHTAWGDVIVCRNGKELRRAKILDAIWVLSPGIIYATVGITMAYLATHFNFW